MTISGISSSIASSSLSLCQVGQAGNSGQASRGSDAVRTGGNRPPEPPQGGGLGEAILGALADIGLSGDASDTTATSASGSSTAESDSTVDMQNVAQAFGSFMHTLIDALHAQGASQEKSAEDTSETGSASVGETGRRRPSGGPGRMESDLQSLIQSLSAGSATGTGDTGTASATTAADSASNGSSTGSTNDADLESSFGNLLSALGVSGSNTNLKSFLQALQSKLDQVGPSGNIVNTTA